jgi:hypothetical protein
MFSIQRYQHLEGPVLPIFGRKKKEKKENLEAKKTTPLEQLCGDDKEIYDALLPVMFLNPKKIEASMKQAADNAKRYEKEKDMAGARMWYQIAGGLAIYEGNVRKVTEYFESLQRVTGQRFLILRNPEKAVAKAQEYYQKYLPA